MGRRWLMGRVRRLERKRVRWIVGDGLGLGCDREGSGGGRKGGGFQGDGMGTVFYDGTWDCERFFLSPSLFEAWVALDLGPQRRRQLQCKDGSYNIQRHLGAQRIHGLYAFWVFDGRSRSRAGDVGT